MVVDWKPNNERKSAFCKPASYYILTTYQTIHSNCTSNQVAPPQNKKVAAAQGQKLKKGILTEANYSLNGNDTIVRYFWVGFYCIRFIRFI